LNTNGLPAPRIELIDVVKAFPTAGGEAAAVRGVSLAIGVGEVFGIIGESGAGKSTLIRLMNFLERPTAGRVLVDGEDLAAQSPVALRRLRRRIGMIFQHFNLLNARTVAENVAVPLRLEGGLAAGEIDRRVSSLLERVGIGELARKYPRQLSGGQKQRVGIARALACQPKVLLCDEATSALDPETSDQILKLLAELNRELDLTVVMVTHEMDVVRGICDRVAVLDAGRLVETGDVIDVFLNAEHAATRRLLRQDDLAPASFSGGRTFRLTYRGAVAAAPFLSQVARETGIDFSLHSGRAGEIKGELYGQLVVSLDGAKLDEAVGRFQAAGVQVRELGR
jgi:D-methionine transport system ATP-binding protein